MKKVVAFITVLVLLPFALTERSSSQSVRDEAARLAYVPNRLLIKMKPGADSAEGRSSIADKVSPARVADPENLLVTAEEDLYQIELDGTLSVEEAIAKAGTDPRVEFAEPDYLVYTALTTPNDTFFDQQWGLMNTGAQSGKAGADIGATSLWDLTQGGDDVVVAVTDTGIDINHPDLAANTWVNPREIAGHGIDDDGNGFIDDLKGWNFADNNNNVTQEGDTHGTHVTGIIGAVGNNGLGVSGVAWRVKIMALKFIRGRSGDTANAIKAINYAIEQRKRGVNLRVINASWGGPASSSALRHAIKEAKKAGILFVCAAGNGGTDSVGDDIDQVQDCPSCWSTEIASIISVAALDRSDRLASFSNFGHETVNVGAPGVQILSTLPGGGYGFASGTSMATPHISGTAVLILTREPELTPAEVRERIITTAQPVLSIASRATSSGRANAFNASTLTMPGPVTLSIGRVTTSKRVLTIDGLGFTSGSIVEANGAELSGARFDTNFVLAGGLITRVTVKLGKAGMNATFPAGVPVSISIHNPTTGEVDSVSYTR